MTFGEAVISFYVNSFNFRGRASRSEYWWSALYQLLFIVVAITVSSIIEIMYFLFLIFLLLSIIPSISVTIRRLHDTDKPWYNILISCIPYIGSLILLFFLALEGTKGKNKFGFPPSLSAVSSLNFPKANVFNTTKLSSLYKDVSQQKDNTQEQAFSKTEQNHDDL